MTLAPRLRDSSPWSTTAAVNYIHKFKHVRGLFGYANVNYKFR